MMYLKTLFGLAKKAYTYVFTTIGKSFSTQKKITYKRPMKRSRSESDMYNIKYVSM